MRDSLQGSPPKRNSSTPLVTAANLPALAHTLARRDEDLAHIIARFGPPPLWARPATFATLVHIILEQQVSLASARAAFDRLRARGAVTAQSFLTFDDTTLRAIGFSRQKTLYCRLLAEAISDGTLKLAALQRMNDADARAELIKLKGIGAWTADIYLLMALRRADIWPQGDLGLLVALQQVKRLPARPNFIEFDALGEQWRPYRAVAARLLWHHYLSQLAARRIKSAR